MSYMSQYYFKCFMAFCCSSTFNLSSFFTLLAFSLSYFGLPFFIVFLLVFLISHTYSLFILPSQQQFIHCICQTLFFLGAFTRDGFTCFIYAIIYFFSIAEHFVTKISPELNVLFLYKFFVHPLFNANAWLHVTHKGIFFHGSSGNCDFLNFI